MAVVDVLNHLAVLLQVLVYVLRVPLQMSCNVQQFLLNLFVEGLVVHPVRTVFRHDRERGELPCRFGLRLRLPQLFEFALDNAVALLEGGSDFLALLFALSALEDGFHLLVELQPEHLESLFLSFEGLQSLLGVFLLQPSVVEGGVEYAHVRLFVQLDEWSQLLVKPHATYGLFSTYHST